MVKHRLHLSRKGSHQGQPMRGEVLVGDRPWLPYPSGWFCVGFSRELPAGKVLTRRFMGEDVVVYRTRAGAVRAVRPYCPHLGAHLGVGGSVEGELLVCPFHRFAFDPEGACAKVPVGKPPRARLDHYPIREQHGILFVWHGEGEPEWELPEVDGTGFEPPVFCSKELATHPQEILENVIDYAHLRELHGMDVLNISPLEAEGPYLRMNLHVRAATLPILGDIVANQPSQMAGLGWNLAELTLPDSGVTVRTWGLPTPTGPWQTRLNMATACAPALSTRLPSQLRAPLAALTSRVIATTLLRLTLKIFDQDQPIWNHKKYEPHPRLGPEDKGIGPYRRWVRQFYPLPPEMPEAPVNGSCPTPVHEPASEEAEAQH